MVATFRNFLQPLFYTIRNFMPRLETIAQRLQHLINLKNISGPEAATLCGVNKSQISKILNGETKNPRPITIEKIAKGFGCNLLWFRTGEGEPFPLNMDGIGLKHPDSKIVELTRIPVVGKVPAGIADNLLAEDVEGYLSLPDAPPNSFALVVSGDSMSPGIRDGDYVLFVIDQDYNHNDIVIVNNEHGEPMIKRLKIKGDESRLVSDNPEYPSYVANGGYRITGKVIAAWRNLTLPRY